MTELVHLQNLAARANSAHLAASGAAVSALEHARTAGEALNAAKGHVPHGEWLKWLDTHFDGSRDTAANYMRIASRWDELNVERVPHLTVRAAIASLSEPKPPKPTTQADRVAAAIDRSAEIIKAELAQNDGWLDDGTGEMVHVPSLPGAEQDRVISHAVIEETYERRQRQGLHIRSHYENHDAQGKVLDRRKAFFDFVARQPCLRCGTFGVEVAHIRLLLSRKTGDVLPRRSGPAHVTVVPLCPACHRHAPDSIHNVGEEAFSDGLGRGQGYLLRAAATLIVEFFVEGSRS